MLIHAKTTNTTGLIACLYALALISAWTPAGAQETSAPPAGTVEAEAPPPAAADSAGQATQEGEAEGDGLAGTSWQLVKIMSMDDHVYEPDDKSKYTLTFRADGAATVQADCNRGTGPWTSESAGQLQFGPIASTKALCPPSSLSERFLAQFQWVRSYRMENGHLFLATMADGSIIELEPVELPLAATVLGEEVRTTSAAEMQGVVLTRLFDLYAKEQGIEVSDAEIDAFVENLRSGKSAKGLNADEGLTPEEAAEVDQMRRDMARAMISRWKLNQALYRQYGGRIIYQQFGPEPVDAYRRYLEERLAAGDFAIQEEAFEDVFWRYFRDDSMHTFFTAGSKEEAQAFATPPWKGKAGGE